MNPESRSLVACLWLALAACVVMITLSTVRIVGAEDDCAMGVWNAQSSPIGMLCIGEPLQ